MTPRLEAALAELADALLDELRSEAAPTDPERLLDVTEAAALLGVGRSRLYDELTAGRLKSVRVGRRRLVPASSIAGFIREGER
jgi:excisionase family DNA binding protein